MQKTSKTVLFASPVSDFRGGAERSMFELIKNTKAHGYTPVVIVPRTGEITKALKVNGIKSYIVNYDWWVRGSRDIDLSFNEHRLTNGEAVIQITQIIEQESPFMTVSYTAVFPWLAYASSITNTPHIWQVCEILSDDTQWKLRSTLVATMSDIDTLSAKVFTNSVVCREKTEPLLPSHVGKMEVIYPYVDQKKVVNDSLLTPPHKIPTDRPVVCIVGNIQPAKGQLDAVLAVSKLKKYGYNDILLLIIGNELDNRYVEEIKQVITDEDLENNVLFTGYTDNPHAYVKRSLVALVCSPHEAFGRITVEAMATGTPVIGLDSDGTAEIIGHTGKYGYLYPEGSISVLSGKIRDLLDNKRLRDRIAYESRVYVKERFTLKSNQRPFFNFIEQFVGTFSPAIMPFADIVISYTEIIRNKDAEISSLRTRNDFLYKELTGIRKSKKYRLLLTAGKAINFVRRPRL